MKNGKKPTRAQKALLMRSNLDAEKWLVERVGDGYLIVINRETGATGRVPTQ